MCRAHNVYLAEHDYGREVMARYRRSVRHAATALVPSARQAVMPPAVSP
jgi:hypothetical protein